MPEIKKILVNLQPPPVRKIIVSRIITQTGSGSGDVTGPGSSTSGNVATFSGSTGKVIQDSGLAIANVIQSGDNISELVNNAGYITSSSISGKADKTTTISAGTGLSGGGDLSTSRTLALSTGSQASLALADTSLQPGDNISELTNDSGYITSAGITGKADKTTTISAGTGLSGGGDLSTNRTISLSAGSQASLALADSALQSGDNVSDLVNDAGYIDGNVGSTNNAISRADGTGGTSIKGSAVTISDSGDLANVNTSSFTPITAPSHAEGKVYYDTNDKSLVYFNDESDVAMNIGREMWARVRNSTGSTITNGQVVYISGATGQLPNITLAKANTEPSSRIIGVATHDIENNTNGYVTVFGEVKSLDTSAFSDGDILYVSPSVDGGYTSTKPSAPNFIVQVGVVEYSHVTQGKILVHPDSNSVIATGIQDSTSAGRSMLTATNADAQTALLSEFTSSTKGLVPASGGGTTTFLRADGSFATPLGSGDVVGPESSGNEHVAIFDGETGKLIADSGVNITDLATASQITTIENTIANDLVHAPETATENGIPVFTDTSGTALADTGVTIDNLGNISTTGGVLASVVRSEIYGVGEAGVAHLFKSRGGGEFQDAWLPEARTGNIPLVADIDGKVDLSDTDEVTGSLPAASVSGLAASATTDTTDASNITSGTLGAARLPAPTTTTLGGVKRNTGSGGQFVNGIDTDGSLQYGTPSGSGTVTSVGLSVPTGFAVSGSPITSSGTLAVTFDTGYTGYTTTEQTKLSGIEAGADVTDATNVAAAGAVMTTGDQTVAGTKTFSAFPVTPSSAPTTDYQVANKKYVDDHAGGGGGLVLDYYFAPNSDRQVSTSETWADITGLSITVTPASTSSRFILRCHVATATDGINNNVAIRFTRNGSPIGVGSATGSRIAVGKLVMSVSGNGASPISDEFLDSPATTSALTYKVQFRHMTGSAGTSVINGNVANVDADYTPAAISSLSVTELAR